MPGASILKQGSHWQGEVQQIDDSGNLITNFNFAELHPLAEASKLWIGFEKSSLTVRGLQAPGAAPEPGKLCATQGLGGLLEITVIGGSAAAQTNAAVGDRVDIFFRS